MGADDSRNQFPARYLSRKLGHGPRAVWFMGKGERGPQGEGGSCRSIRALRAPPQTHGFVYSSPDEARLWCPWRASASLCPEPASAARGDPAGRAIGVATTETMPNDFLLASTSIADRLGRTWTGQAALPSRFPAAVLFVFRVHTPGAVGCLSPWGRGRVVVGGIVHGDAYLLGNFPPLPLAAVRFRGNGGGPSICR